MQGLPASSGQESRSACGEAAEPQLSNLNSFLFIHRMDAMDFPKHRVHSAAAERGKLLPERIPGFFAVENPLAVENFPHPPLPTTAKPEGATAQIDQKATDASKALRARQ